MTNINGYIIHYVLARTREKTLIANLVLASDTFDGAIKKFESLFPEREFHSIERTDIVIPHSYPELES